MIRLKHTQSNIMQRVVNSTKFSNLIDNLKHTARESEMLQCHAAMLLDGNRVMNICCNAHCNSCCGMHGLPSMHAEAGVLRHLYGRKRRFKGGFE